MCDYTQVQYRCHHVRYTVRAWCTTYESTHRKCPPHVVAVEFRLDEKCGDCKQVVPDWFSKVAPTPKNIQV